MSLHKLNTVSYQAITCCHLESGMAHWKFLDFPLVSLFVQLAFDFSGELSFFPKRFLFQPDKKDWTDFVNKPLYNSTAIVNEKEKMTHILTNPGYPNSLRFRSKSVDVLREHEKRKEGLPKTEFDKIRSLSRQSWKDTWQDPGNPLPRVKSNHFVTTYSTTHNYRALRELTPCRPTSPTRRNNPHPTRSVVLLFVEVFIINLLTIGLASYLEDNIGLLFGLSGNIVWYWEYIVFCKALWRDCRQRTFIFLLFKFFILYPVVRER